MRDPQLFDIRVCHCRIDHDSIYIGRGSPLGNPFPMRDAHDDEERDEVCDKYDAWFRDKVRNKDPEVMDELTRLMEIAFMQGGIHLGCFCAPQAVPRRHHKNISGVLSQWNQIRTSGHPGSYSRSPK